MGQFSREEIEAAFERYQDLGLAAARSGDWSEWGKAFTEDCSYKEHCLGEWGGRDAVVREMAAIMHTVDAGDSMAHLSGPGAEFGQAASSPWMWVNQYPINDYVIDVERGWVWSMIWQRMDDPGNGKVAQCNCLTLLYYAGNGQFSFEEDLYNPKQFAMMFREWERLKDEAAKRPPVTNVDNDRVAAARAVALETDVAPPDFSQMRPERKQAKELPDPRGRYPREEIQEAFDNFQQGLALAGRTNDWRHFGAHLTTDATLLDCEMGMLGKRDSIVREIEERLLRTDDEKPWAYLNHFPIGEYVIDTRGDAVWTFVWARFRDPGDGSKHEAKMFLRLIYNGEGLFREIETLFDRNAFRRAVGSWKEAKARCEVQSAERSEALATNEQRVRELAPLKLDAEGREVR